MNQINFKKEKHVKKERTQCSWWYIFWLIIKGIIVDPTARESSIFIRMTKGFSFPDQDGFGGKKIKKTILQGNFLFVQRDQDHAVKLIALVRMIQTSNPTDHKAQIIKVLFAADRVQVHPGTRINYTTGFLFPFGSNYPTETPVALYISVNAENIAVVKYIILNKEVNGLSTVVPFHVLRCKNEKKFRTLESYGLPNRRLIRLI